VRVVVVLVWQSLVGRIPSVELRQAAPLCLGYHLDKSNLRERLVIGDDSGAVSLYNLRPGWHVCDGTMPCHSKLDVFPNVSVAGKRNRLREGPQTHKRALKELAHPLQPTRFLPNTECGHTDHVVQVDIVPDLNSIVTASLDTTCNVIDLERGILKRKFKNHKKPVYSFAWCGHNKVLASCGLERDIILWSPYSERAVATLTGHLSAVRKVIVNDKNNQLISLGADNVVKVWDIRNQRCIQTLNDARTMDKPTTANSLNIIMYNRETQRLFASSSSIRVWDTKPVFKISHTASHDACVVSALYNRGFNQVVSADTDNHVVVWDVETGQVASQFEIDSNEGALTAIAFDNGGRRLVTGTHKGAHCSLFNFSNGCLLTQLDKRHQNKADEEDSFDNGAAAGTAGAPSAPKPPTTMSERALHRTQASGTRGNRLQRGMKPRQVDAQALLTLSPKRSRRRGVKPSTSRGAPHAGVGARTRHGSGSGSSSGSSSGNVLPRASPPQARSRGVAFGSRVRAHRFDFGLPHRAGEGLRHSTEPARRLSSRGGGKRRGKPRRRGRTQASQAARFSATTGSTRSRDVHHGHAMSATTGGLHHQHSDPGGAGLDNTGTGAVGPAIGSPRGRQPLGLARPVGPDALEAALEEFNRDAVERENATSVATVDGRSVGWVSAAAPSRLQQAGSALLGADAPQVHTGFAPDVSLFGATLGTDSMVSVRPSPAQQLRRPASDSVSEVTAIEYCVHELPRMRGQVRTGGVACTSWCAGWKTPEHEFAVCV